MQDAWLNQRRMRFIEQLLTLGPLLGIVLAFIGDSAERVLLAQYLVILVTSSIVAYFLLIFELPFKEWTWRLYYSMASVGIAYGFGFLIRLTVSFYGDTQLQNLLFVMSFLLLSAVLVLPFKPAEASKLSRESSVGPEV